MAQNIKRKYNLNIQGILSFEEDTPIISIEDRGDFDLIPLLKDFGDREVKISVSYDEDYNESVVDPDTGEII